MEEEAAAELLVPELEPELEPEAEEPEPELEPEEPEDPEEEPEEEPVELEPVAAARGVELAAVAERKPVAAVPLWRPGKPEMREPEEELELEPEPEDLPEEDLLPLVAVEEEAELEEVELELGQVREYRGLVVRVSPTTPKEGLAP